MSKIESLPNNPDCNIIILSTYEALNKIRQGNNSKQIFCHDDHDTPQGILFANHYSAICSNTKTPYLVCSVLMSGKKVEHFSDEIYSLDNFFRMTIKKGLKDYFNEYVGDFQKSRINAIEEFGLQYRGCEFHFIQAQVKHLKSLNLYKRCYSQTNKLILTTCVILSLIEPKHIRCTFKELRTEVLRDKNNQAYNKYFLYFQDYWLNERNAKISQWNHYKSIQKSSLEENQVKKIGNLVSEGKISQINRKLNYSSKPSVNVFMLAIDEQMQEDCVKVNNRLKLPDYGVTQSQKENNVISKHLVNKLRENMHLYFDEEKGVQFQEIKNFYQTEEGDDVLQKLQNLFCSPYYEEDEKKEESKDLEEKHDDTVKFKQNIEKRKSIIKNKMEEDNLSDNASYSGSNKDGQENDSEASNIRFNQEDQDQYYHSQLDQNNLQSEISNKDQEQDKNQQPDYRNPKLIENIEEKRKISKEPFQVHPDQINVQKDVTIRFQQKRILYYYIEGISPDCQSKGCSGNISLYSDKNVLKQKCNQNCGFDLNISSKLCRKLYLTNKTYFQSLKIKYTKESAIGEYPEQMKKKQKNEISDSSEELKPSPLRSVKDIKAKKTNNINYQQKKPIVNRRIKIDEKNSEFI